MAIADDISVAVNGDIRYTGSTANHTVLAFHRFLQDLADDEAASGDDLHDITSETSSDRSTDNIVTLLAPYNIDDTLAEHLFDGSVTQSGGATVYSGLVVVGTIETGTQLQIIQDDALLTNYWGTGLNADAANNILLRLIIKTRVNDADIDGKRLRIQSRELGDSYAEFPLTLGLGNSTAAIFTSVDLNNQTAEATIATYDQFNNTEGFQLLDVTGDAVGEPYYSQWDIGGGTIPASPTINDLYERTKWIQRRATVETIHSRNGELFRGITHEWAYDGETTGPFTEDAVIGWGTSFGYDNEASGPFTLGEYLSFGTSGAVGKLVFLQDDGATGIMAVAIEPGSGTVVDNDPITGLTSGATADVNGAPSDTGAAGGSGLLIALDDQGVTGEVWIQLLSGAPPVDNLIFFENGGTADALVNGSVTTRTVSPEYLGVSTGSAIIGAFGIGIEPTDLTASDQLFDLDNVLRVPPNNVTFTVFGLVSGEDRVLVGPEDGAGGLDRDQMTLNTSLTGAGETAVVLTAAIPVDTPTTGIIRIQLDTGIYRRIAYTSYTASTFTIASTDFTGANNATAPRDVFVGYIDKLAAATSEAFTTVFNADRTLFIRVRDGGSTPIKTFETTGTLGSAGGAVTAIRTPDA